MPINTAVINNVMDLNSLNNMAQLIKQNGEISEISPANGSDFQLEELQEYVGGCIDIVSLDNGNIMVINDDGKFTCELNDKATDMAHYNHAIFADDYISGDVVVCKNQEVL